VGKLGKGREGGEKERAREDKGGETRDRRAEIGQTNLLDLFLSPSRSLTPLSLTLSQVA
jgi:hypothetical protein